MDGRVHINEDGQVKRMYEALHDVVSCGVVKVPGILVAVLSKTKPCCVSRHGPLFDLDFV